MLQLKPLSPGFGLEATGVDLSDPMSDEAFAEIEDAFFDGQVLTFRHQQLSPREFLDFARRFGPPEPHVIDQFHHPDDPNILILSNVVIDGEPQGLADAGTYFHTDYSYLAVPARATMLYSIEVPEVGGNTLFANQYAAYDDLPAAMKRKIDPLIAVHHYGNRKIAEGEARTAASTLTDDQKAKMPLITHPVVRSIRSPARRRCTRYREARTGSSACPTTRRSRCSTSSPRTRRSRSTSFRSSTAWAIW